jgi:hypothetical protein
MRMCRCILPKTITGNYNYYVGKAHYIENPLAEAFKICRSSFKSVDTVLRLERILSHSFPPDKKYTMEQRGKRQVKEYSVEYSLSYHKMLKGMVQRRMRAAIFAVGSFWYSAWVDAGQPDLNKLIKEPLTNEKMRSIQKEEVLYKSGKVLVLTK